MKKPAIIIFSVLVILIAGFLLHGCWTFFDDYIAPLFLDSRVERIHETGLPKASLEKGGIIYCRMKADDFRFPLPPGITIVGPISISGGFDTVDGNVEVSYGVSNRIMSTFEYKSWALSQLAEGGSIDVEPLPDGMKIHFHYFGDR